VRINSPGGDAFEGVAIYNLLRALKKPINVFIDGIAARGSVQGKKFSYLESLFYPKIASLIGNVFQPVYVAYPFWIPLYTAVHTASTAPKT